MKIKILLSILLISLILISGCKENSIINDNAQLPNPSSVYCKEQGGLSEIRTNPDGSQIGYCIFLDGSECEEWAFYRGECEK